jgi:hypothetical protein
MCDQCQMLNSQQRTCLAAPLSTCFRNALNSNLCWNSDYLDLGSSEFSRSFNANVKATSSPMRSSPFPLIILHPILHNLNSEVAVKQPITSAQIGSGDSSLQLQRTNYLAGFIAWSTAGNISNKWLHQITSTSNSWRNLQTRPSCCTHFYPAILFAGILSA